MAFYPIRIAQACPMVEKIFVSTDSPELAKLGASLGAEIIERPPELATKDALGEDAFTHGKIEIQKRLKKYGQEIELLLLLFANAPTFTPEKIEEGIRVLRENPNYDSAVTVSSYNMWSPLRARKLDKDGLLRPFVPFETFGNPDTLNCDRNSQGEVWFADMGFSLIRPKCLNELEKGLLPQKWMGNNIYPLRQWGGLDVDEPWQIPIVEAWLRSHEINRLFQMHRLKWNQLYDSERSVYSTLELSDKKKVLDLGNEPGALGLILMEKFGITDYTGVESNPDKAKEARIINPNAKILEKELSLPNDEKLSAESFDVIFTTGLEDSQDYLTKTIPSAFRLLSSGGKLVGSLRLTEERTISDPAISKQTLRQANGAQTSVPYIIRNAIEVLESLRNLHPSEILLHGYAGRPSSTAQTPLDIVCFCIFSIRRHAGSQKTSPQETIELPQSLKAYIETESCRG